MQFVEYSLIGIASGSIFALVALGFVLINKSSNVFNFAMGEMMMLGAYFMYTAYNGWHAGIVGAVAAAIIGTILLGMFIERVLLRPLIGEPPIVLVMVTLGVASVLRGVAGVFWGADVLQLPAVLPRAPVFLGDVLIPGKLAWGFVLIVVIMLAFIAYYRFSRAGIAIRATSSDQATAASLGINIRGVITFTWVTAAGLGALAGIIAGSINGLTPQLGDIAIQVLAVVMLSGLTSVTGVLVAGLIVGWISTVVGAYFGASWQTVIPYLVVLLAMSIRPQGLFGEKTAERI